MALKDILVGVDPSTAGKGRLKLALNLVRAHQAHITACYIMREKQAGPGPILPGVRFNPGPGVPVSPEASAAAGDPLSTPVLPASREAERAEQVEELFRTELRAHELGGEWHLLSPGETAIFIDLAKSFDLTILGQLSPEIRSTGFARTKSSLRRAGRFWSSRMPAVSIRSAGACSSRGTGHGRPRGQQTTHFRCSKTPTQSR